MWKQSIVILCLLSVLGTGCQAMGKATGKAVKGVEDSAQDFKQGYKQGKSE